MGLPMFQEPDEVAAEQPAAKLDQLAAAGRSSIRRESTVRPGRFAAHRRAAIERVREEVERRRRREAEEANNSSSQSQSQREPPRDTQDPDEATAQYIYAVSASPPPIQVRTVEWPLARRASTESEARGDMDMAPLSRPPVAPSGRAPDELTTAFIFDSLVPEPQEADPPRLQRRLRESGLRYEVVAAPQPESEPLLRPRFSDARSTRVASPSGSRRPLWSFSVHRPMFADTEDEENDNRYRATSQSRRLERSPGDTATSIPPPHPPEMLEAAYPPLRRVNHISPRPPSESRPRVDGLGDRLRSPSPISDGPVEENWGTLLDTMETSHSSTATSFLSSRSNSRSGSNQSSQATTTATSFGEIGGDDSCDLDLPSGITEEDVREIRARHGRLRRDPSARLRRREARNLFELSSQNDPSRINERVLELEMLGVILDRMQRREEIPDDLWAAVGLSPDIVRGTPFDLARQYA
ncbi:uncharacterized protein PV07_03537 [Cladophialophora immunda]|uniref:Uncharacterized protein n=1 Tax=Cladophialophora immunda TaxID=569365 RepID=A0A0D1ZV05_9EURO|nr:uncharacterized protein PV07_03537 [Cladophialophora immunda]KIW31951.1 hypothetical protein PV07_03537 [Cladophialophora immunda]OQU96642.1 hypothetical protein CLAIMM_02692 [Cladophialophora immunda]